MKIYFKYREIRIYFWFKNLIIIRVSDQRILLSMGLIRMFLTLKWNLEKYFKKQISQTRRGFFKELSEWRL